MLAIRLLVVLGLMLGGAVLANAQPLPDWANPVPVARDEEGRNVPAENCADKLFKERARDGQLVLNASTGHGEEYDRLYRACLQDGQRLGP
ncbi:MAG: hypothetical protein HYS77_16735 [Candidatus Rokubacteria bacterium]|nr:hypothetical protein [Candidatus Rokubacteria bacterium]